MKIHSLILLIFTFFNSSILLADDYKVLFTNSNDVLIDGKKVQVGATFNDKSVITWTKGVERQAIKAVNTKTNKMRFLQLTNTCPPTPLIRKGWTSAYLSSCVSLSRKTMSCSIPSSSIQTSNSRHRYPSSLLIRMAMHAYPKPSRLTMVRSSSTASCSASMVRLFNHAMSPLLSTSTTKTAICTPSLKVMSSSWSSPKQQSKLQHFIRLFYTLLTI